MIFLHRKTPVLGTYEPYFYALYFDFKEYIMDRVHAVGDFICLGADDVYM